jgi:hypothetical protein
MVPAPYQVRGRLKSTFGVCCSSGVAVKVAIGSELG